MQNCKDHITSPEVRQHFLAPQNLANGAMLLLVAKSIQVRVCQTIYLLNVSLALLPNKIELKFDLNSSIGKENSIMFKDSVLDPLCLWQCSIHGVQIVLNISFSLKT